MANSTEVIAGVGLADRSRKSRWPARMDLVQSASGLALGLFMWGHMFFVSSILISNDAEWLKRTLARWTNERDTLPTLTYEPLDVSAMELPPGWRGYGAKDYIEHPETAARQEQVDALKAQLAPAGRFAVQEALMPYDELLPPGFRGKNERIDERF